MRIGQGYDVHRLTEGRKLILGGVDIPYDKGLLGHSDADVLSHAIMDALLGAAALGDIGQLFPDTDERYAGADSLKLLSAVCALTAGRSLIRMLRSLRSGPSSCRTFRRCAFVWRRQWVFRKAV